MSELPTHKKIFYGMGGLSMNLCDLVFLQWLYVRYAPDGQTCLVAPRLIGTFILLGRITEAVAGPLIGHWSDGFRSPHGRRLPFIRRGLLPWGLAVFLLWMPPFPAGNWLNAVYLFATIEVYLVCYNMVCNPYLGLLPEITSDFKERVNLTTIQAVFLMGSALVFAMMGTVLKVGGWMLMGGMVAILTIAFMLPVAFGIREKGAASGGAMQERLPFFHALRLALRNGPFLYVVLSTSCYWFGLDSIMKLLPLWVTGRLGRGEDTVTYLMLPFLAMNVVFFFVINYLAKRFGKYAVMLITFLATAVSFFLLRCVGHMPFGSEVVQTGIVMAFVGMSVAGFMVLPFAVLSDVVDYDEKLTGRRREAIYFGFQGTFQKLTLGMSSFIFGMLAYEGSNHAVSVPGLERIALFAGIACVAGFFVFLKYPLRDHT